MTPVRCAPATQRAQHLPNADPADHQLLKLPGNKFTVREREMLIGSNILPPEFFAVARNPFVVGGAFLAVTVGYVLAWMSMTQDDELDVY